MLQRFFIALVFSLLVTKAFPQSWDADSSSSISTPLAIKPTIGLGTGMFSFYGDYYEKHFQNPMTSRIGYHLSLSQNITPSIQLSFFALFGKLGANERMSSRNLNFESEIRSGGISFLYNFGHFVPEKHVICPFVTAGIESFEFLSKTDLYDRNGKMYYYWADGSIRDLDESSPIASTAIFLNRDYTYESDIRELDLDGFGKYAERSFAVPLGIGFILHLTKEAYVSVGSTFHLTFTDYMDGVTEKSFGRRQGNKRNDIFVMNSISLHYNLDWKSKNDTLDPNHFDGVDFLALEAYDDDTDSVIDMNDSCQGTPQGVAVDIYGCPLDDDKDGVPNYLDKELSTPAGSFVSADGVQLTDSIFQRQYDIYMDSTGLFVKTVTEKHGSMIPGSISRPKKEYMVLLGAYKEGISPLLMTKFLSIGDIVTSSMPDSTTVYTVGKYSDYYDAEKRKNTFSNDTSLMAKVVYFQNGQFLEANGPDPADSSFIAIVPTDVQDSSSRTPVSSGQDSSRTSITSTTSTTSSGIKRISDPDPNTVVFRVQLGAYKKPLSKNVFPGIKDLVEIKTEDGLYKYMAGSYSTFEEAANRKIDLAVKGYSNAFVAAYKGGERVSLQSQGATPVAKDKKIKENLKETEVPQSSIDKKLVVFKVQVGIYKGDPPREIQAKYTKITGVHQEITLTGLSRYVVGEFNDYESATALKEELIKKGLSDAFIIAFFNNQYVTVQEALELMK